MALPGAPRAAVWAGGLLVGLRSLRKEPVLALKRLALPVSYWRTAEFAYVWKRLAYPSGARIFDLGSPKDLAAILARHRGYEVVATDILPETIELSRRYAAAQGIEGAGPGYVRSEVADGRSLAYPDNSFDAAFSVSVIEHIPDRGDTDAARELVRIVKPGGLVVITTPYDRSYRETFVDGPVYERGQKGSEPVFFERHYDDDGRITGFTFLGRGWGHGVGMCQVGAYGLARQGFTYEQILKAYYTGIELTRMY